MIYLRSLVCIWVNLKYIKILNKNESWRSIGSFGDSFIFRFFKCCEKNGIFLSMGR